MQGGFAYGTISSVDPSAACTNAEKNTMAMMAPARFLVIVHGRDQDTSSLTCENDGLSEEMTTHSHMGVDLSLTKPLGPRAKKVHPAKDGSELDHRSQPNCAAFIGYHESSEINCLSSCSQLGSCDIGSL